MKTFPQAKRRPAALLSLIMIASGWHLSTTPCRAQQAARDLPAGFKPLFDGRSLTGWHTAPRIGVPKTAGEALAAADKPPAKGVIGTAQAEAKGRWAVQDGVITGGQDEQRMVHKEDGADWGLGSWLMSDATYGDFELLVDARPDWPCDTGIYVRSTALGQGFQILLDHRGDDTTGMGGISGFSTCAGLEGCESAPTTSGGRWAPMARQRT